MATLRWSGVIASAGEYAGSGSNYINGRIYCEWSRSNNTITLSGFYVGHSLNSGYDDYEWQTDGYINGSLRLSNRQTKGRTGVGSISGNWYYSSTGSHSVGVGTGSGSITISANWKANQYGQASGQQSTTVAYSAAGSPAGTSTIQSGTTTTSIPIRNNVTTWGTYCTAGDVRSYIANNSGFSGQTYIATTDNALVTHTGLVTNTKYWFRGWCSNGAGLTSYMNTVTDVTLPVAPVVGTIVPLATTASVPTTLDAGGGFYAITKKYRLREAAGTWGAWTTYTPTTLELTGLTPSQDYEIEVQSVTTAGTTSSGTSTFTTLPAGKLIYSNGDVKNAIPRKVVDGEATVMLNMNKVDPA